MAAFEYQSGFGNYFSSEAISGSLPLDQNNPKVCPLGLYAEQLSGTAFTVDRGRNLFSWLYRLRPAAGHSPFVPLEDLPYGSERMRVDPNQMRWSPFTIPEDVATRNFYEGMRTVCGSGQPEAKDGLRIAVYVAGKSMSADRKAMVNSDGDFLIVPQVGTLHIKTEFGHFKVEPNEIIVIPRGIRFSVDLEAESVRGYVLEVFKGHFELPSLGAIGANGLANRRDFMYPVAAYEDVEEAFTVVQKFMGSFFQATYDHSPFDVVAWHGNYAPFKYDLRKFCVVNTVSFDHLDPSIFTVLTCPSSDPGTASADFVIFPPRWMVAQHTFRPPYYHRNCMTEFMGMIWGKYDAKKGFAPGGASLHSCMTAHGPDRDTFVKASAGTEDPVFFGEGLAFMFETNHMLAISEWALGSEDRDREYQNCWTDLPKSDKL